MPLNRAQFRKNLQQGLNATFGLAYKDHQTEWTEIFDVTNSKKAYEEDVLMSGFGAAPIKMEGAGVTYDTGSEAWVSRYQHLTISLAFAITQEAEEDGLYGSLGAKYSAALARSMQYTKEVYGANTLNNGFSGSYLGGDGVALFSTAHPLTDGGTFANKLTTAADISETSLEDALIVIDNLVDDRGIPVKVVAKKLIIPTALRFTASRLLNSDGRPGTPDNDINAIKNGNYFTKGIAVNHFLTDTDAWFITTDCPDGLKCFNRKSVERGVEGDFETGNMRYKARERYSFGWTDPRGAFASEGA